MPINIEEKSKELKEFVSVYDTKTFMGDLSVSCKLPQIRTA